MAQESSELDRIRAAYTARDASGRASAGGWADPGYRFYMEDLEWWLLHDLGAAGVTLADAAVLEVGCGSGYFLHRLREYGASRVAGIDLMADRVADASARYPTLELVAGDAAALPWGDGVFDVVTQFTCLSSVLDPRLQEAIAADMWRVCRPGGAIVSYDMRRTPAAVRALGRLHARASAGSGAAVTPTVPLTSARLGELFPAAAVSMRVVSLNLDVAQLLARRRPLAAAAARLPLLRTHLLAVVRKPS